MEILLHRHAGLLKNSHGRAIPLSVFFDERRIGSLELGETRSFLLPASCGSLQVGMTRSDDGLDPPRMDCEVRIAACTVASPVYLLSPADDGARFEVRTYAWVLVDICSFCYLPWFNRRVFRVVPIRA